jgi:hypothetical protein
MVTHIVYDYKSMAEKCFAKGLFITPERICQYILHGLPIKKDKKGIVDLVFREESVAFAEGLIRSLNKAGWGKYIKERINQDMEAK